MVIAVPAFGTRVAPTFLYCEDILLARVIGGEVVRLGMARSGGLTENERIKLLEDSHVSVLVCGGIDADLRDELTERGIEVIHNVAGETDEVLKRMAEGWLAPGYGISYRPGSAMSEPKRDAVADEESAPAVDCVACVDKICLRGHPCQRSLRIEPRDMPGGGNLGRLMEAAMDIAAEPERVLCRIAEVVYFALEMKYKRLGLAFCADLFSEAETVARVLGRFFEVVPVCCRIGGPVQAEEEEEAEPHSTGMVCSAPAMAKMLNRAGTDMNIAMGLSIGSDIIFSRLSLAPVTTLFVKDRLLANNPVSAVHSRYVLEQVLGKA